MTEPRELSVHDFRYDPDTGYYDVPHCYDVCCRCERLLPDEDVTQFGADMYCEDCHPKCCVGDCDEPAFDGGEGCCAKHELDVWIEELRDDPSNEDAKKMIAKISKAAAVWK